VDEDELRLLARAVRGVLPLLVPNEAERSRVAARLEAALATPRGQGESQLLAALSSPPVLREWVLRHVPQPGAISFSTGQPAPGTPARHLAVEVPERVPPGCRLSLLVRIALRQPTGWRSALLKPLDIPPHGATVTVTVSAPGLYPVGDLEQDLHLPADGDSEPVRFGFTARRPGLHTVLVRAFRGGTFLGELAAQVSVEPGAPVEPGVARLVDLDSVAAEPGEVTLEVSRTGNGRYSFRLLGEAAPATELAKRLAGDPRRVRELMVAELCRLAAGTSPYTTPAARRRRLRNLGVSLWADAVPEAVRRQFWEQRARIRSFTVASDLDAVPWELLYPADDYHDEGFLVEQFPVVRRVARQGRARRIMLRDAAYVVPPGAPRNAMDEIRLVRETVGAGVRDHGVVERLGEFDALLERPPSLLHFACHNDFTEQAGAWIRMGEGPLSPADLAPAVQKRSLRDRSPLVFLNACRTADDIPGLTRTMGWATQFMAAGAGAFLGTLWAVRSSTAQRFTEAFYACLVTAGRPLGQAALEARRAIADADDGDPTWLAYSVYGHPGVTVAAEAASPLTTGGTDEPRPTP
jgi:hypothetical protein